MRTLSHFRTLLYYDEPQIFIAHDVLDITYICLLVNSQNDTQKYLCVPISKGRLEDFINGNTELRAIIEFPEVDGILLGSIIDGESGRINTSQIGIKDIQPEWLPEPGFFLKPELVSDIKIVNESIDRQRAIIHCSLNPPEAKHETKISAEHLSQAVKLIQRVVSHAYKRCLRDIDNESRKAISHSDNYELEIFTFSPGSFTVHMQTKAFADMLGYSPVSKALNILDRINQDLDKPEMAVQTIASYGGHFATAYKELLQFIVENKTPMSYEWSMPERKETTKRNISDTQAETLYKALMERTDIGKEEKRLIGILKKVDVDRGTWRLFSEEDNTQHSGQSESGVVELGGLVMEARYEFICEEQLIEERGTGRELTVLHLKNYRLL